MSFSKILQELSNNYYNHRLSFSEYRSKRREILDNIDAYFNSAKVQNMAAGASESLQLGNTMTFSVKEILHSENKEH